MRPAGRARSFFLFVMTRCLFFRASNVTCRELTHFRLIQVRELGFEPRQADPESAVLPLHHSRKVSINVILNCGYDKRGINGCGGQRNPYPNDRWPPDLVHRSPLSSLCFHE